ncbi:hypothetical protein BGZ49_010296 [Haplosporangium sp. Z 27]|nr:hypothetical protein BGZ49_010296 [Haplosporangium sp. Z 27]
MNVLIAIMNDGYGDSRDKGQLAWLIQWSEVLVEAEVTMMLKSTRRNRNLFPDYIYYGASSRDVEMYSEKDTQAVYFGDSTKSVNEELHELADNQKKIQSSIHAMSNYIKNLEKQLGQRSSTDEVGDTTDDVGVTTDETVTTETISTTTNTGTEHIINSTPVAEYRNPDGTISHEDTTSDKPPQGFNPSRRESVRPQIPPANILAGNITNRLDTLEE